ncbi:MAG: hypothetical protein ALAOOOJD_01679 [bacterium]|nr:hypothetical protein [bacterium]
MSKKRFILRFRGTGARSAADIERVRALRHATVLDDSSPRMLLVEGSETELESLLATMPGWIMTREQMIPLPDPRPKVRRAKRK